MISNCFRAVIQRSGIQWAHFRDLRGLSLTRGWWLKRTMSGWCVVMMKARVFRVVLRQR
jgi:hypothetical protein